MLFGGLGERNAGWKMGGGVGGTAFSEYQTPANLFSGGQARSRLAILSPFIRIMVMGPFPSVVYGSNKTTSEWKSCV